jgi:ATP-binding cassette subfamily B protein
MDMDAAERRRRFAQEMRLIWVRARQVWRLIPTTRKVALGGAALIMILTSAGNTAVALMMGRLVDSAQRGIQENASRTAMYWLTAQTLGIIAVVYVVRELLTVYRRMLVEGAVAKVNRDMQIRVMGHLLRVRLSHLGSEKVGALHGRIFRSVDGLSRFLRLMFLDCLPAFFTGLFALSAAVSKHFALGFVMLGVVPLAVWLTLRQLDSQKGVRLTLLRDCEEIDGTVVEQLGGAEYIRVANTAGIETQRLAVATEKRRRREVRHHFEMSLFGCAKALNEGAFHLIVLGTATVLAIQGYISMGDVLAFSVLFLNVMAPLNEIHRVMDEGHECSLRVGDLVEMLREPIDPSFVQPKSPIHLHFTTGRPAVVVENLVLDYETADGEIKRGLNGVSLVIRHGETIGVAGPSGSGKSTWIKALLRLAAPTSGKIFVAQQPLEHICRDEIARIVGYVGQNPFVFSGTVRENIAYGHGEVDDAHIKRAAEMAHLHEEILAMPRGYDTVISERGGNLSGGQRQRMAIARILLQHSPILILDEATSALDNISERYVQRSLGVTSTDRTTIIIAHRLTTLKDCDRILVFDKGRIVEEGDFETLVRSGGIFAELVHSGENGVGEEEPEAEPVLAV